jgi:hypothetical protein
MYKLFIDCDRVLDEQLKKVIRDFIDSEENAIDDFNVKHQCELVYEIRTNDRRRSTL